MLLQRGPLLIQTAFALKGWQSLSVLHVMLQEVCSKSEQILALLFEVAQAQPFPQR